MIHIGINPGLCGAIAVLGADGGLVAGVFVPNRSEVWGGRPGKRRLYVYGLCAPCKALPDVTVQVEGRIMGDLAGRTN